MLPRVAPRALTAWAAFDADGDGDDEVLVWRTDPAGAGALTEYHFARGPALDHTVGPLYGAVVPGLAVRFARDARGARFLLQGDEGVVAHRAHRDGSRVWSIEATPRNGMAAQSGRWSRS